jgi:hypothetical protein
MLDNTNDTNSTNNTNGTEDDEMKRTRQLGEWQAGAPAGARQHVRSATEQGAVSRPGGATQNSGGAIVGNDEAQGEGPGRGAD